MNKCVICNKEIKNDSQFIKVKWYHNDCIENLNNIINKIQKELKILKHRLITLCDSMNRHLYVYEMPKE